MSDGAKRTGLRRTSAGAVVVWLCAAVGCAKVVGIEDTPVTRSDAGAGGQNAGRDASAGSAVVTGGSSGSGAGTLAEAGGAAGTRGGASGNGGAGGNSAAGASDGAAGTSAAGPDGAAGTSAGGASNAGPSDGGSRDAMAGQGGGAGQRADGGRDGAAGLGGADGGITPVDAAGVPDAGPGAPDGAACTAGGRCGAAGHETCTNGQWAPDPCPVNQPTCEGGLCVVRGPVMVKVSTFYVDSTEVTVADYRKFLAAKGADVSGQPAVCSWNTAYHDAARPFAPDTFPMGYVDWCDARAYCAWAGKHLCGKIGGGPIAIADAFDPTLSQWDLACGGPNGASHPNANATCNSSNGFRDVAPVKTFPMCEGYYPGLFDLQGNVAEWVDSCEPGDAGGAAGDTCHLFGGGIFDQTSYCSESYDDRRDATAVSYGFRCCGG